MNDVDSTDEELVKAVLRGNHDAFRPIVDKYQKLVWHIVYRMVQNSEDCYELSQEVFLRVYNKLDSFRFESKLSTWIGRIAFNIATRHLQKKKLPLLDSDDNEQFIEAIEDDFDLTKDFLNKELTEILYRALESLAPVPRTILTLFYLDELSISEVSDILGKPEGTIKNSLFRARATLKAKLKLHLGKNYD